METLSANWFVWLGSPHQLNFLWFYSSLCKGCRFSTINTNGCQFVNFFRQRNQIDDVSKRLSLEGAIKSCNDNNNSFICQLLSDVYNIVKELSLIDSNNVILKDFIFDIIQLRGLESFVSDSRKWIKNYLSWVAITSSDEYLLSWR